MLQGTIPSSHEQGEAHLNDNPTFGSMTTTRSNPLHEYEPMSNVGDNKEQDNSIQINIHLIEEAENNTGGQKNKCQALLIISSIITSRLTRYFHSIKLSN